MLNYEEKLKIKKLKCENKILMKLRIDLVNVSNTPETSIEVNDVENYTRKTRRNF